MNLRGHFSRHGLYTVLRRLDLVSWCLEIPREEQKSMQMLEQGTKGTFPSPFKVTSIFSKSLLAPTIKYKTKSARKSGLSLSLVVTCSQTLAGALSSVCSMPFAIQRDDVQVNVVM